MPIKRCKDFFKNALTSGCTPERLTRSFCIGIYIAFSPFPGAHTIMMFAAKYLFDLHFPTLFFATSFNNPWTMVPFFSADYAFGYWFLHSFIGWDPGWAISLAKVFGSGTICIWSFLIGGNVLGIAGAALSYPIMSIIFKRLAAAVLTNQPTDNAAT